MAGDATRARVASDLRTGAYTDMPWLESLDRLGRDIGEADGRARPSEAGRLE
jgi:hypothetical protein